MHDLSPIIEYYETLLDAESSDDTSLTRPVSYAQATKLLSLVRIDGLRAGSRVLDIGCGVGDLKGVFDKIGPKVEYTGYDISPKVIERARQRYPDGHFEVRDILRHPPTERYDFVLCADALSFRVPEQGRYVLDMIRSMFSLAQVAVGFNMLSAWSFMDSPSLQREVIDRDYEWPNEMFSFCKTLSRHVSLNNDAAHGNFTVFVYRNHRGALDRYMQYASPGTAYGEAVEAAIEYHLELGLYAELRDYLHTVEPKTAAVWNHIGQAYAGLEQHGKAIEAFEKAIELNPALPWPHVNLAKLASKNRDIQQAINHLRRAVAAEPSHPSVREELTRALLSAGRRAEARTAAAELPEGALREHLIGLALDDPKDALAAFERAIEAAPAYLEAIIQAAFARQHTGDREGALELWQLARTIAPMDDSITERLVACANPDS